eukprot:scaffold18648_cov124-Isochrysis_galbana.AAC.10
MDQPVTEKHKRIDTYIFNPHSQTDTNEACRMHAVTQWRMRQDTLLSSGGLASPPFPPLPLPFPPARDILSQVYTAVGGGWALCST